MSGDAQELQAAADVAHLGSSALIDLNHGDRLSFVRIHPSATIKIGNVRCSLAPLVDAPYGSAFELQRGPDGPFLARISPPRKPSSAPRNDARAADCSDAPSASDVAALGEDEAGADDAAAPHGCGGDVAAPEQVGGGRDNRRLVDDNTAQKLSAQDIHRLRTECASGQDIVKALVANSATFHTKTAYSQEKYTRKKQKKYAPCFVLRKPSARRICEAYFSKTPQKIGFLRMDTMSLMLSLANVGPYGEVLVMDMVAGLLTAAVAERIGGFGSVLTVYYTNRPPPLDIVGLLNLNNSMASRVFRASIWEISAAGRRDAGNIDNDADKTHDNSMHQQLELRNGANNAVDGEIHVEYEEKTDACNAMDADMHTGNEERASADSTVDDSMPVENVENQDENPKQIECDTSRCQEGIRTSVPTSDDEALVMQVKSGTNDNKHGTQQDEIQRDNSKVKNEMIRPGRSPSALEISQWAKHGFTSLLVAALELDPWSIIRELLPLLSPSSPFVIYHRYLQPLAQCMHELQASKMAIGLEIVEPWLREYQVLPSRTHPHMQMNATGGYILTGIKLAPQ